MEGDTAIEKSIKEFVYAKIQEQVVLDISKSNTICIKSRAKHGSTALAMFWLRVLRHQNNYPMPKYPYKDVYDKQGHNKVILKVDSVTITTLMSSGVLMMQGSWVLEWFINTFQTIMDVYDEPARHEPLQSSTVYRQYTESWKKVEEYEEARKAVHDAALTERESKAMEILDDRKSFIAQVEEKEGLPAKKEEIDVSSGDKLQQAAETAEAELAEELELMTLDIWSEDVLKKQLNTLQECRVKDGSTYIYRLWKSLLHNWFSDATRKVFIVTPMLDAQRLVDICHIVLQHRIEANLDTIYVHQQCDHSQKIHDVKKIALDNFDAKDQMYLEYKIYSSIIYPAKMFNAKFIGCIKDNEAEVLVTSASFHGDHFDYSNMETVFYQKMSDVDFISRYLGPINASVHRQK